MHVRERSFSEDIERVNNFPVLPLILETICHITGMGFAAVARVTQDRWVACSVLDKLQFGLVAGGELEVETTICHEIRQSGKPVVIDHVIIDKLYSNHHTPARYGLQSYISVPIFLESGSFFGTLCAIDGMPALVSAPGITRLFNAFAALIALYLDATDRRTAAETELLQAKIEQGLTPVLEAALAQPPIMLSAAGAAVRDQHFYDVLSNCCARVEALHEQLN